MPELVVTRQRCPDTHRTRPVASDRPPRSPTKARDIASGVRVDHRSQRVGNIAREVSVANAPVRMIRKSTYERGGGALRSRLLGSLGADTSLIAKRVQQLACTTDVVVWLAGDRFFAAPSSATQKIPPEARVGTYGIGVLLVEIEEDLRRFRAQTG
jgi:hypothetical protein